MDLVFKSVVSEFWKAPQEETSTTTLQPQNTPPTSPTPSGGKTYPPNESIASDIRKELLHIHDTVDLLIQRVEELEGKVFPPVTIPNTTHCYICRKPVKDGEVFCSDNCAKTALPVHGIMLRNNGVFVSRRVV